METKELTGGKPLLGCTPEQLRQIAAEAGCSPDVAGKIAYWLYRRRVNSTDEMESLGKDDRKRLGAFCSTGLVHPVSYVQSADGTRKYLFRFGGNRLAETALMPGTNRYTLCVSSQAGCRMGCDFCNTASGGFRGHLSAGEIVTQLAGIEEAAKVNHIVVMGMGEPFDNTGAVITALDIFTAEWGFSIAKRYVTVSTVGLMPGLQQFAETTPYNLAISLHSPFDSERAALMPVQKFSPIGPVLEYLRQHPFEKPRRLTFEYLVLDGINHSADHAAELARLLKGLRCHVNLIAFNPFPGSPYRRPGDDTVMQFRDRLDNLGLMTTIRRSRGADIEAACGLLAAK